MAVDALDKMTHRHKVVEWYGYFPPVVVIILIPSLQLARKCVVVNHISGRQVSPDRVKPDHDTRHEAFVLFAYLVAEDDECTQKRDRRNAFLRDGDAGVP